MRRRGSTMNSGAWTRKLSINIPSPPPEPMGSAHVSIELPDMPSGPVLIQADCTFPPWQQREMQYCGPTSTNNHLFTMLYENIIAGLVRFRMWADGDQVFEDQFYERAVDKDGNVNHVAEPWVFDHVNIRPLLSSMEKEMSSIRRDSHSLEQERRPSWRRHRRQNAVSLPTPPTTPDDVRMETRFEAQNNFAKQ